MTEKQQEQEEQYIPRTDSTIAFELPWPPSVNHYWGHRAFGGRVIKYLGAKGRAFREAVKKVVEPELAHCKHHFGNKNTNLEVLLRIYPPDKRRRDTDNLEKALWDALEEAGVMADDSQIDIKHVFRNKDEIIKGGKVIVAIVAI